MIVDISGIDSDNFNGRIATEKAPQQNESGNITSCFICVHKRVSIKLAKGSSMCGLKIRLVVTGDPSVCIPPFMNQQFEDAQTNR